MNQTWKPIAGAAANACAVGHVLLIEHDSTRGLKWVIARCMQVVKELLDAWLMGNGRIGIWGTRRRFGRVHSADAVHMIHLLGLRVKRLHVVVADGPRWRNPVVFAQLS